MNWSDPKRPQNQKWKITDLITKTRTLKMKERVHEKITQNEE
jgi:hypothetical protein